MGKDPLTRKLAVILHADVVGSTSLVQQNETLAHERIQYAFKRFSGTINTYGGMTREVRGDALVAEFSRASDAVSAALAFQTDHTYLISRLKDDLRPTIRVGIAMGEVVVADETVTGSGVVLAQRVEQLADPGGVFITAALHEALPKHMPFDLENLGEQVLKGFDDPVLVYRAELTAERSIPAPEPGTQDKEFSGKSNFMVIAAVTALVLIGGVYYWFQAQEPRLEPVSEERMAFALPDNPSVAVLPFNNLSNDKEQEYFADGMTEDLITDLSKIEGLFVIARNSVFTYKGESVKVRQVAEELGVRYVMEGSVQRSGNQIRVNAQLIDATTGGHIWAERYDGNLDDVFSMRDKITRKIIAALSIRLGDKRVVQTETKSAEAYDAYLRGWKRYRLDTPEDLRKAVADLEKAIELDPEFVRAKAALAAAMWKIMGNLWWMKSLQLNVNLAGEKTRLALREALKEPSALSYQIASERAAFLRRSPAQALADAEKAIKEDANDPAGYLAMAGALIKARRATEAVESMHTAMRLDPHFPASYLALLGQAYFAVGDYEQAAESLQKATIGNPDNDWNFLYLAATYGHLGHQQESEQALETANELRARANWGAVNLSTIRTPYFKWLADIKPLREGLIKAGVKPEANWSALIVVISEGNLEIKGTTKIDVHEAKVLHERGVPFVDVHPLWLKKHIPGAHFLDFYIGEFNEVSLTRIANKNQEVVIYSSGSLNRSDGAQHCAKAATYGFEKVYYLPEESLDKWEKAGYPLETATEYYQSH